MSGNVPPQFQDTAKLTNPGIINEFGEFKRTIQKCFDENCKLYLETIHYEVQNTHCSIVRTADVYIGVTKHFIKYAIQDALRTRDLDMIVIFFPDLNWPWRVKMDMLKKLNIQYELFLTHLSLQIVPKCNETWCYRRWLYKQYHQEREQCEIEWDVIYRSAQLHKCNYYAWEHARWLLQIPNGRLAFDTVRFENLLKSSVTDCSIYAFASFILLQMPTLLKPYHELSKSLIRYYFQTIL